MSESAAQLSYLRDSRLSAHAISASPAWLWAADATRILWANAVGAAIFGADDPAALAQLHFSPQDAAAIQVARIAGTLPQDGPARLERLRGFGAGFFGRALMCMCSRITLADGSSGILVTTRQSAGPSLTLEERVRRVVGSIDAPFAVFAADGALLYAAAPALSQLAAATTLSVIGAEALAADALRAGRASGSSKVGALSLERIGGDAATALIALLPDTREAAADAAAPVEAIPPMPVVEPPVAAAAEPVTEITGAPAPEAIAKAVEPEQPKRDPEPMPERRHPLRFVWQMDANGRFAIESSDFIRLTGPRTAQVLGRPWSEIAATLGLDPEGQVAAAIATRDTWSGISIAWPVDGTDERLTVELSGLPNFDRDRAFIGYRGFGVCRDARRVSMAAALRYPPAASAREEAAAPVAPDATAPAPEKTPDIVPQPVPLPAEEKPVLSIVPAAKNVVPFRSASAADKTPSLSAGERSAFHELARQLTTRLQNGNHAASADPEAEAKVQAGPDQGALERIARQARSAAESKRTERAILDRLPVGVLVYRLDTLLYANRAFLDWCRQESLAALVDAGGLDALLVDSHPDKPGEAFGDAQSLTVTTAANEAKPAPGRLFTVSWEGDTAHVLMLLPEEAGGKGADAALKVGEARTQELESILDTAADGVLLLDRDGKLLSANSSAEALFGYGHGELESGLFADLFTAESEAAALDCLENVMRGAVANVLSDGREVSGLVRRGGTIPLFMTMGKLSDEKFCAVFRNLTQWKKAEEELINARRQAEKASVAKSEFLAKISHEIRTPLNAIIGFSEVMMGERFGPIANERYREYLKDIHASGGHLVSLLNDLLDLSKIEAGKVDLNFASINLNELMQQCVALMQPQANQQHIIIRTSLPQVLPPVLADARSVRQITLNLLSNSIKFTGAGGQVILSTALTDSGDMVLRVRDTGVGMNENEIQIALEPFRQLATSTRWGSGGTGLGLPLAKALAEANHATFNIKSAVNAGTLVEVSFPSTRVLAS
jgi:PAS domain S-box-containing protein